ncbi:GIY-YIG nuclease family protein [Pseudoalteromonas neustonica]|uniref:GIY-YIG nuclease family protein n=1 Tax=Pseudoalteromonas neustonica TaxID=1840331 RepID=A0ABU9U6A1_9GAMM
MIRLSTFKSAITNAINQMDDIKVQLEQLAIPSSPSYKLEFHTNEVTEKKITELVKKLPSDSDLEIDYIYLFKVSGENKNISRIKQKFKTEKKRQQNTEGEKKDLCRINDCDSKQYFYVGRSQSIKSRIRQHLSHKYKGTYALHMERWCRELDHDVEVLIYEFEGKNNMVIQAIEDALWDRLNPCFGRKGDK